MEVAPAFRRPAASITYLPSFSLGKIPKLGPLLSAVETVAPPRLATWQDASERESLTAVSRSPLVSLRPGLPRGKSGPVSEGTGDRTHRARASRRNGRGHQTSRIIGSTKGLR